MKCSKAKIEAVAIDMSPAYISAISQHVPRAAIVFDHFHVIKLSMTSSPTSGARSTARLVSRTRPS